MAGNEVSWGEAAWLSSLAMAAVIVAVGIAFFSILILTSMSLAKLRVVQRFFYNFVLSFIFSFLNLFLLFGAVFAFPAVVINSVFVTMIYAWDDRKDFAHCVRNGTPKVYSRFALYLFVAVLSTIMGACIIKYTPGVLHKSGEVPPLDWQKDFQTWEGLGGWITVNLGFGIFSLLFGSLAETWMFHKDVQERVQKTKTD